MEIVERRKSPLREMSFLSEPSEVTSTPTKSRWRTWIVCLVLACVCTVTSLSYSQWLDVSGDKLKVSVNVHQLANIPAIASEGEDFKLRNSMPDSQRSIYVQDAVVFPDNVMLMVRTPDSVDLQGKMEDDLECRFGGMRNQKTTPVMTIKARTQDLQIVRCRRPSWIKDFPAKTHQNVTLGIGDIQVQTMAVYNPDRLPSWDYVVYESLLDSDSIVLLVKGLVTRSSQRIDGNSIKCVFGEKLTSEDLFETRAISAAQEVVRCEKPPAHLEEKLRGFHLSVTANWLGVMPSVTYYNPDNRADFFMQSFAITSRRKDGEEPVSSRAEDSQSAVNLEIDASTVNSSWVGPRRKLCACTMLWNKAQFLKEWVTYHSFLGVERYFVYDNDSDDNLAEVVESLLVHNISRMMWPWIKTQQAAFSHCTIVAREECEWVMFVDVDEYIFPSYYFATTNWTSAPDSRVLHRVIDHESAKWAKSRDTRLGEIQFDCNNFGPSGLDHSPEQGVTVGYICRLRNPERHKSLVLLDAVNDTLLNVLHHFELRTGFSSIKLLRNVGVVNHYKYQAWDVFKMKFVRRAGTYTTDWQKAENKGSKDRTPGLGTKAVKPDDWEQRFCEIEDTKLREFVLERFKAPGDPRRLRWEV